MAAEPSAVEQAVSRTLRDNLGKIQRAADELHQAINDLVSACGSSRPTNALPPMLRAQTSAASLSATLEVLSRFVTAALQPAMRSPSEQEVLRVVMPPPEPPSQRQIPEPLPPQPMGESSWTAPPVEVPVTEPVQAAAPVAVEAPPAEAPPSGMPSYAEPVPVLVQEPVTEAEPVATAALPLETAAQEAKVAFDIARLPAEEQEMHRRAYRMAKVSMQDIKLLRPAEVRAGRQSKDLCVRLRRDIEKAHKEYDRRFQTIQSHPVDYFYDWMVEILAGGDPEALGEYPYPSPVLHR